MAQQEWLELCHEQDLIQGGGVCALVGKQQIAIFADEKKDKIYAVGNYDPAGQAEVLYRGIIGDVSGELVVASPLFKHHYSLRDGRCLEDGQLSVPVFPSKVNQGRVFVSLVTL